MRMVIVIRFPVERTLKFNNHLSVRRYILRGATNKKKKRIDGNNNKTDFQDRVRGRENDFGEVVLHV